MNLLTRAFKKPMLTTALAALLTVGVTAQNLGQRGAPPRVVRVAAASDLRFAMDDVASRLREVHPDVDLKVTYGSSGTFFAQLLNGAPFDLFMSADTDYPKQLAARGLTVNGSEFTYAVGHLVIWVPEGSPIDPQRAGWQALVDTRVAHVSIANPATAPYGRAAEAAMRQGGVYERVKPKLVLGENVAQAFQFVQSGAAEAGIVALSLALAPTVRNQGRYWMVPSDMFPPLDQGGVILKSAGDVEAARAVRAFLTSNAGRAILQRYGFLSRGQ